MNRRELFIASGIINPPLVLSHHNHQLTHCISFFNPNSHSKAISQLPSPAACIFIFIPTAPMVSLDLIISCLRPPDSFPTIFIFILTITLHIQVATGSHYLLSLSILIFSFTPCQDSCYVYLLIHPSNLFLSYHMSTYFHS